MVCCCAVPVLLVVLFGPLLCEGVLSVLILFCCPRRAQPLRQGMGLPNIANAPSLLLDTGTSPIQDEVWEAYLSVCCLSCRRVFLTGSILLAYGRAGLVPHGGRGGVSSECRVCNCFLQSSSRFVTRPRHVFCVLFLVATAPQPMLGTSRVGLRSGAFGDGERRKP